MVIADSEPIEVELRLSTSVAFLEELQLPLLSELLALFLFSVSFFWCVSPFPSESLTWLRFNVINLWHSPYLSRVEGEHLRQISGSRDQTWLPKSNHHFCMSLLHNHSSSVYLFGHFILLLLVAWLACLWLGLRVGFRASRLFTHLLQELLQFLQVLDG